MARTIAIIGAGPIGLAAAHGALRRGHVPIVLEAEMPGAALRRFGPTRFFSPLSMNLPPALLGAHDPSALLTGPEIATILEQIATSLGTHVHTKHRVIRVTRHNLARGTNAGHPVRAELPFRVVASTPDGDRTFEVDAVLDASGTYGNAVPLVAAGAGAIDAIRDLGALDRKRGELAGKRVLMIGHGHSAANAAIVLENLVREAPETRVTWAFHSRNLRPLETSMADPLPERARVVHHANALASKPPPWLEIERAAFVESFSVEGEAITVTLSGERKITVDHVVALIGSRPDLAPLSELPLEISPVNEGSARIQRALANVTDCLSVPKLAPEDLASGEPRFHLVGHKSYGRSRTFLLQTGYAQLETILDRLFE